MTYFTIDQVRQANQDRGQHFFDSDTMRFFKSRVNGPVVGGRYFISSERFDHNSPRLYTIRSVSDNGSIGTVGEFQQYKSKRTALNAARALA